MEKKTTTNIDVSLRCSVVAKFIKRRQQRTVATDPLRGQKTSTGSGFANSRPGARAEAV